MADLREPDTHPTMRVLVVEDNSTTKLILSETLREFGFEPVIVESAEEAKTWFSASTFKIIVLDLMLPGMDGVAFCRWVREQSHGDVVHVLVGTASASPTLEEVLEAGANDYLQKPYEPKLLRIRLEVARRQVQAYELREKARRNREDERLAVAGLMDGLSAAFAVVDPGHRIVCANRLFREKISRAPGVVESELLAETLGLDAPCQQLLADTLDDLFAGRLDAASISLGTAEEAKPDVSKWVLHRTPEPFPAVLCVLPRVAGASVPPAELLAAGAQP